jgi:hypothetical protein
MTDFVPAFTSDNSLDDLAAAEAEANAIVLGRVTHRSEEKRDRSDLDIGSAKRGKPFAPVRSRHSTFRRSASAIECDGARGPTQSVVCVTCLPPR